MLVRIVKDWDNPNIFRQIPGEGQIWDNVEFTIDPVSRCDILIVLNSPERNLFINTRKGGRWLFSQEPATKNYRWHTNSFRHFNRVYSFWDSTTFRNIVPGQTALPWHINKSYDELQTLPSNISNTKKNAVSWVTSSATNKPGHKLRMRFKSSLEEHNFTYHLYGRGFNAIENKLDGIYPYKYSIAFENFACPDYWTEKLADCFLSWTMPIYYGCTNIFNYFPKESIIHIDPTKPMESITQIKRAIAGDWWKKNLSAIEKARNLILDKYQFFPTVVNRIKASGLENINKRQWHFIPRNTANFSPSVHEKYHYTKHQTRALVKNLTGL